MAETKLENQVPTKVGLFLFLLEEIDRAFLICPTFVVETTLKDYASL